MKKNKVIKHLKGDIKTFSKEASEDRELIKDINKKKAAPKKKMTKKKTSKKKEKPGHEKFEKVMREFSKGTLRSGSKKGPKVKKLSQARAIGFSEDRKADKTNKGAKKKKK